MVKRVTLWKMGLGAVLFVLVMGILGGLVYLTYLTAKAPDSPQDPGTAQVLVFGGPGREWFNGTVAAKNATALSALEEASEAENLHLVVDRDPDGGAARVLEINARATNTAMGQAWHYWVKRDGAWLWGERPPNWTDLRPGDTLVWMYGPAPEDPARGPEGITA